MQSQLVAKEFGLYAATENCRRAVAYRKAEATGRVTCKQFPRRPGQQYSAGTENGQCVDKCHNNGEHKRIVDAQQREGYEHLAKSNGTHYQLGLKVFAETLLKRSFDFACAFKGGGRYLVSQKADKAWISRGDKIKPHEPGHSKEQPSGQIRNERRENRDRFFGELGRKSREIVSYAVDRRVNDAAKRWRQSAEQTAESDLPAGEQVGGCIEKLRKVLAEMLNL